MKSADFKAHTAPLFKSLNLLPFSDIYDFSISKLMFKIMKGTVPPVLNYMFNYNLNVHGHNTRQSRKLHIPLARTELMKRTFRHKGVNVWNTVLDKVDCNCSFYCFKKRLKAHLLSK